MTHGSALLALADPTRQRILEELRRGGKAVGEIAAVVPVSRPAVSQHLKVLKGAGLVREERSGTRRIYNIEPRGLVELQRYLSALWGDALASFQAEASRRSKAGGRRLKRKA